MDTTCSDCSLQTPCLPPSSYDSILFNDSAIGAAEEHDIREQITSAEASARELEGRINRLRKALAACEDVYRMHQEYIHNHKSLITAHRHVPPEIWSEIFQIAQASFDREGVHSLQSGAPCMTLGHVCHSWREIVIGTPVLWSSITLNRDFAFGQSTPNILDAWLTRSSSAPLSITLFSYDTQLCSLDEISRPVPSVMPVLIGLLQKHVYRWRSVVLVDVPNLLTFFRLSREKMPLLESFVIDCGLLQFTPNVPNYISVFPTFAPRLHTFVAKCIPFQPCDVPWSSLTTLELEGLQSGSTLSPEKLFQLLSNCTSLEKLTLTRMASNSPVAHTQLYLRTLASLAMDACHLKVLDSIEAPVLKELSIKGADIPDDEDVEHRAKAFIGRCPNLQSLELQGALASILSQYRPFFGTLRHISILNISETSGQEIVDFLDLLELRGLDRFPNLTSLSIELVIYNLGDDEDLGSELGRSFRVPDAILGFLKRRVGNGHSKVEQVGVRIETEHWSDFPHQLQAFEEIQDMGFEGYELETIEE